MLRKIIICLLLGFFSVVFFCLSYAIETPLESIRIVENGKSQAVILISDRASEAVLNSAKLLSNYLQQSTKVRIPIHVYNRTSLKQNIAIHVGTTAFSGGI